MFDAYQSGELGRSLSVLNDAERATLAARASEKNGKLYFRCLSRDKDVQAKPEEVIRQVWLHRLTSEYGYPLSRIRVEDPITMGRDTSKRADIVITDEDHAGSIYAIIEIKHAKEKDGKDQLKSYTNATGAPLAMWSNGVEAVVWNRNNPNHFTPISAFPTASQTIAAIVNEPWTIQNLLDKEAERAAKKERARTLRDIVLDMENEVLANAGVDVFEEVFKLVFIKLYDEMECHRGKYAHLRFRNNDTAERVKRTLGGVFDDARAKWPGVFPEKDVIRLNAEHLKICVGSLESWKLFNSNLDVVDDAFEYLVNQSAKGEKGQYFTPRWVIDMCAKMLNPQENESVVDTAAGSAGFTLHAMFHVWNDIMDDLGKPRSNLFTMDAKHPRCTDYVRNNVFAIDFDERCVRVARCLNLIAGDGETNVLHLNALDWKRWADMAKDDEWNAAYNHGWQGLRKRRTGNDDKAFSFDILMANPPFAGDIKQDAILSEYDLAHNAKTGKREKAVGRDLLFIERNLDMLRPGGRMAVVLPQGRFNNASDKRVRDYIMERCRVLAVVGLHPNSFKPHTGTKTSVLFVQKWNDDAKDGPLCPKREDYDIFFATQQMASKDTSGDKIYVKGDDGRPLRDSHGHFIVAHDLFNHDGLTRDGISEAFQEFGRRENLSFFH